ncbi:PREDICTED: receptor-like protein kinase FERONIA [Nelumbo nucifera]|uniref:Receptor-like protein kinase FERONIA n=1 Tax=Nelumbo nucifera TaxID=4432 RepID=A0A1U7ZFX4_NELNU|nr:PREDICTED: receptor-like protein kinase FERONIA [Nelumbo nucifera]
MVVIEIRKARVEVGGGSVARGSTLYHHSNNFSIICVSSYTPNEQILLDCGSSALKADGDGRNWTGDVGSDFATSARFNTSTVSTALALYQGSSVPLIPYVTARIFHSPFTYTFPVAAGPKLIRLYFYPVSYSGLDKTKAFFDVSAGPYTLLHNFSAFFTVEALKTAFLVKEFSINIENLSLLEIIFTPTPNTFETYGFVNGIEILSMPEDLYVRGEQISIPLIGQRTPFYIAKDTALETVYRLNIGGRTISSQDDTGMYRTWYDDTEYILGTGSSDYQKGVTYSNMTIDVNYPPTLPNYTAPDTVYRTARSMGPHALQYNLTWHFLVDLGFQFLFRLHFHFCELAPEITLVNQRVFSIFIGNQTADNMFDVVGSSGGNGIPMFKDYTYLMTLLNPKQIEGKQDLWLTIHPNVESKPMFYDAILNGLEIFKLMKDTRGNFVGPNLGSASTRPDHHHLKKWIWFIVAGGVVVGVVALALFSLARRCQRRNRKKNTLPLPSDIGCRRFSLSEIKAATDNFNETRLIGVGGFGSVYRGYIIDNGVASTTVAIKRGNPKSQQGAHEFRTEIEMLSKLRHVHLVSLIGYCEERGELILVYDYMAQGTLRNHLYNTDKPLTWKKRLEICIEAARGLDYLHTGTRQTIIHRDVKTTNILLDEKLAAKVSDFGLSKVGPSSLSHSHTHVSTAVKGSFGYLDPEYYRRQKLTEKSDVYSFGVVLFEVVCGRPALDHRLGDEEVSLAHWAPQCLRNGTLDQIIDPYLKGKIEAECLSKFTEIADKCLADRGSERPTMANVL